MAARQVDVLVIGGGPAGCAAGFWLARHGHDVTILERRAYPRDKTCAGWITPAVVAELGLDVFGLALWRIRIGTGERHVTTHRPQVRD